MSDLRPRGIPIVIDGVERHCLFTLNAIDELQEKYEKSLPEIVSGMTKGKEAEHILRDTATVLFNTEARKLGRDDLKVTEYQVGDMIALDNYGEVLRAVLKAYGVSMPEPEDDDPNGMSARQSN